MRKPMSAIAIKTKKAGFKLLPNAIARYSMHLIHGLFIFWRNGQRSIPADLYVRLS